MGTSRGSLFWKHRVKRGFSSLAVFLPPTPPPVLRLAFFIHWVEGGGSAQTCPPEGKTESLKFPQRAGWVAIREA